MARAVIKFLIDLSPENGDECTHKAGEVLTVEDHGKCGCNVRCQLSYIVHKGKGEFVPTGSYKELPL